MSHTNLNKLSLLGLVVGICALAHFADAVEVADKIVGGTTTNIESFPYILMLKKDGRFICGSSLVAELYVVTAAHCIRNTDPRQITVTGGSTAVSGTGVTRNVVRFFVHPQYNPATKANDIAVMKLDAPMTGPNIRPIPLSNGPMNAGMTVRILGWGGLWESGSSPDRLQTATLPLISKQECIRRYFGREQLSASMLCAAGAGKDTCQGDSGGPVEYNGRLVGVVSWGYGCARPQFPGVYTSMQYSKSFVNSVINSPS